MFLLKFLSLAAVDIFSTPNLQSWPQQRKRPPSSELCDANRSRDQRGKNSACRQLRRSYYLKETTVWTPEMGAAVIAGVSMVSTAVAAASVVAVSREAPPDSYQTFAIMALCAVFHGGIALLIHGVLRRTGAPPRQP
uniref:PGG domain-containing protein n=1 Tax=Leersia perrieri TaxID=77586 RepID=A0A0D9X522_9ORYZ